MAQKEFKRGDFAKPLNFNVFFGDYLHYISWVVENSKTVDTLAAVLWYIIASFANRAKKKKTTYLTATYCYRVFQFLQTILSSQIIFTKIDAWV